MANHALPTYLANAQPNPLEKRAPWYLNTAQSYAGIFLWIAFFDTLAGTATGEGALKMLGLGGSLMALIVAGAIAFLAFYFVPGMLGMRTGLPLYVVGSSTFGTVGGYFLPGIFMGLLQIGWFSVGTYYAAILILEGIGLPQHAVALYGQGGQFSPVFVAITIVWGIVFALVGAYGIQYVARVATFFPIVPIVMLLLSARIAAPYTGQFESPISDPVPGFLLIIQLVIGFFATAGAAGVDFCANNRDVKDVTWGGIMGIWLPIVFAGGLALITVAGAKGKDPNLTSLTYSAALPVLTPQLGQIMKILFAIGSVAPACFCSFIIGNSLSTMVGNPGARVPLTLGGAAIGIVLAALGVAGNLAAFFGLIGASFGPVVGAMIADYLLSGGKWAGPRRGINLAGYGAWLVGFVVGIQNHPWIGTLPGWDMTAVYSLVTGFLVYLILARLGLEPPVVEAVDLRTPIKQEPARG
jgi:cytosine permease